MRIRALAFCLMSAGVVSQAHADRRNYVWTYQYQTMYKGGTELEFYQTTMLSNPDIWEYRIEIEHGLTERWDFSVYQIFRQEQGEALKWDAVQLRTRYRLGEEGQWFMDPLFYLEYNRQTDLDQPEKLEGKLILAKTLAKFNLALNPVYEFHFSPGTRNELGLDVGCSWEFCPMFSLGLESTSRWEFAAGETAGTSYFGPTVSLATQRLWYTLGTAWGVTGKSDNTRIRFLMGVSF